MSNLYGQGRAAIELLIDRDSFRENLCGATEFAPDYGPAAVVGTAIVGGETATIIAIDALAANERFHMAYSGLIGLEEGFKMAKAVYATLAADRAQPVGGKRPLFLLVDTPGMSPGKVEEIVGIYKSTGAYQLACAAARRQGHPIVAVVIGRAISGGFLCHGLQADRILSLSSEYEPMIHVMPLAGIARITKISLALLQELARDNPVFASGVAHFYKLGGIDEIIPGPDEIRAYARRHLAEIRALKIQGDNEATGPLARLRSGAARGGRVAAPQVIKAMEEQFARVYSTW